MCGDVSLTLCTPQSFNLLTNGNVTTVISHNCRNREHESPIFLVNFAVPIHWGYPLRAAGNVEEPSDAYSP